MSGLKATRLRNEYIHCKVGFILCSIAVYLRATYLLAARRRRTHQTLEHSRAFILSHFVVMILFC
jgi:hypothetical protein